VTIRTYKGRRGRLTDRQLVALQDPALLRPEGSQLDLGDLFTGRPITLEIGFGSGRRTADIAQAEPDRAFLVADVFTTGVADLMIAIRERELNNIAVVHGDALVLLQERVPTAALHAVRTWFPDPWPKARHHKRRLVNAANVALIADRCLPGAVWELATDDADYAQQMRQVIEQSPWWSGGRVERAARALTHYEERALQAGRTVTDLRYRRLAVTSVANPPKADVADGERRALRDAASTR